MLLKQQLLISRRSRRRAPSLTTVDRFVLGLVALLVRPFVSKTFGSSLTGHFSVSRWSTLPAGWRTRRGEGHVS